MIISIDWLVSLYNFFVIQNFTALTTLVAGLVVFKIYNSEKRDKKINAARIIVTEIRDIEQKVDEASTLLQQKLQTSVLDDFPIILPKNSWREYSYLFASDLDQDELQDINNFYNTAEIIDEMVKRDNGFIWLNAEYRIKSIQETLSEIINSSFNKTTKKIDNKKIADVVTAVLNTIANHYYTYAPSRTLDRLQKNINKFNKISTTSVGIKIKKETESHRHLL